jgi:hypothetical protein
VEKKPHVVPSLIEGASGRNGKKSWIGQHQFNRLADRISHCTRFTGHPRPKRLYEALVIASRRTLLSPEKGLGARLDPPPTRVNNRYLCNRVMRRLRTLRACPGGTWPGRRGGHGARGGCLRRAAPRTARTAHLCRIVLGRDGNAMLAPAGHLAHRVAPALCHK